MLHPCVPLVATMAVALLAGCGQQSSTDPYGANSTVEDFSELRLSLTVNDPRVKNELERLQAEQSLPLQVAQAYRDRTDEATEQQVARFLEGRNPSHIDEALTESDRFWNLNSPGRELLIESQGREFLKDWNVARTAARNVLLQPKARFPIQLEAGCFADPTWTGTMHCLARAELLEAADQASGDNLSEAVTAVAYALAYADQLNQVPMLAARNAAAAIREEAFITIRGLLKHPKMSASQLRTLETVLQQTIQAWPDDTELWKADRAYGLHFLEVVRSGNFASLLTREEYNAMKESGELDMLQTRIMRQLTMDQAFYLDAMKSIVETANRPYYDRVAGLNAIVDALNVAKDADQFPVISGDFLLGDMLAQHAKLSKDKSRTMIWLAALQTVNGHPPQEMPNVDFSGKPIEIEEQPNQIVAKFDGIPGDIPPLVIPKLARD
ncbi:hypothetical protein GC197_09620 [bacterium]|nr:hypothetical protein [bacterium]